MKDKTSNSSSEHVATMPPESTTWKVGFAQTSGNRNKLCITQLRLCPMDQADTEALFGIFDGGFNNEIPQILCENFPAILQQERKSHKSTNSHILKPALLKAHLATGSTGQKTGASAVVCYAVHRPAEEPWLYVANLGHVEAVLSRAGSPVLLTRKFLASEDPEECDRIRAVDGIITEDSLVNGSSTATRMIGCSYLFPAVIPEPHCVSFKLVDEDELIIMANRGLWEVMTYGEAVSEIRGLPNTITAAKKLVDLAQSYGARGNLSVIVVKFKNVVDDPVRKSNGNESILPEIIQRLEPAEHERSPQNEDDSDDDYFPQDIPVPVRARKFAYPRSASQILIMEEQVRIARSAHSLTENMEPEQNYYFQHRRESLAENLSSGSTSPDIPSRVEKTILTNGDDFEVHVSSSRARHSDISGNTLSGHGDSALGSSVNPSVSDGNGSPVCHEEPSGGAEEPISGATSHCDSKSHDDDAIHLSDPMDDEECRSWQFLMNEALGNLDDSEGTTEDSTVIDETIKDTIFSSEIEKSDVPRPPTPPAPPDPALFFKPAAKFRVTPKGKAPVPDADPKRNKPLIDELEVVLRKRLCLMEECSEMTVKQAEVPDLEPGSSEDKLIRQVKSSYQMVFKIATPPAFVAQNSYLQSPIKRKF